MNLVNLDEYKLQCFDAMVDKIIQQPRLYLNFNSVADFYQAHWLKQFPPGTHWLATGLDDGAEDFCAVIQYKTRKFMIEKQQDDYNISIKSSHSPEK